MKKIIILILVALPINLFAQKAVTEYSLAEQKAVQDFLVKNQSFEFLAESAFDAGALKAARDEWGFGKNFRPYYQSGDFNHDGQQDFAVVLKNKVSQKSLAVVVFHGQAAGQGYQVAYTDTEAFSNELFIGKKEGGKTKDVLYVSQMETDLCSYLIYKNNTYSLKPCNPEKD